MSDKMKEIVNEEDEMSDVVELTDDGGNVLKFYHIGTLEYKGEWYAFFQPAEAMNGVDTDEVVIFQISGEEGQEVLLPVEDEKLLNEVYDEYVKEMEEDEDFEGEGSCEGCESDCSKCSKKEN